ncbi:protein kinase, putative [Bodo saltans]|uniref:non-specific serine/threonine protein kinase n=1 Tax=Bodo saltans TaxID=75058 RepID=A0A0S4INI9_BODSA|nr:protein kinase, putative [Bodo saltans]|eukprot:CUE89021.1 protein kinase, putative [Bodo saltans]
MLCELFTGKAPWGDRNHFSICAAISRGASPNILQHPWPSNCPQEIVTLIARMLSFSPDERGTLVGACTILCRLLTSLVEQHEVRNIAASKTPPFTFAKSPIPSEVCTGSQNLSQTTADSTLNSGAGSVVLRGDDYPPLFSLSVTSAAPIVSFPVIVGNPPPPAVVNENEPRQSSGNLSTQKNQHQQNQRQHGRGHQMDCQVSPLRQVSQFDDDEHGRLNAYCTEMFTASHDAEGRNVPTVQSPVQPFDRGSVISLCSHNGADSPTPFRLSGEVGLFGPLKYLVSLGSLGPLSTKLDPLAHMHTIAITSSTEKSFSGNLAQSFRLPPDSRIRAVERLEVALKIAQSLRHLHSIGCYHCNLSPSTIFLVGGDVNIGSATKSNLAMEHANDIFSAPEVLAQEAYSPEADLYSLGSVLLFMLTSDEPSTFSRVQWPSYCPHEIKCLAERLLACNPKDRGTLQEAMSAIEKAIIKIVRDVCFPDQSRCNIRSILENHSNPALTLRESLLRLEGYAPPIDRPDVKHICALLTKSNLNATYNKICEFVSSMFAGPVDDSISAIALYTAESEMCYAVNAALNQLGRIEDRGRKTPSYVGPIAWRIYQAVQKIGTPYCGKGFRIMYADRSPMLEKIYANYASYFPQGSLVTFCQFTSFSVENLNVVVRPAIVFVCDNLEGYNVDQYSVQSLNGHSESEILVLPPSSFTCKATPYRFGSAVFVEVSFETFTIQQDL